jgi:hypothetical protein
VVPLSGGEPVRKLTREVKVGELCSMLAEVLRSRENRKMRARSQATIEPGSKGTVWSWAVGVRIAE